MRRFSSPRSSPRTEPVPLLPVYEDSSPRSASAATTSHDKPATPGSPFRHTHSSPRSPSTTSASILRPLPLSHQVASEATRDELLALARQSRHLERRLQAQLDAQSAGLIAGLGLEDRDDASSQAESEPRSSSRNRRSHVSPSPKQASSRQRSTKDTLEVDHSRLPPLPTTRRAIHGTLLELAELKTHEAAALTATLEPINAFLSNTTMLEQKKAGLDAAIARQDTPAVRTELSALAQEEQSLQGEIQELEDTLAVKRNRLKYVQTRRAHDASTLDARLSSWRQAAADVEARIRDEVLAGRGLPWKDSRLKRGHAEDEDVWALPPTRRTLDLVKDSVEQDRAAVAEAKAAAKREADAATAGADVWQGTIGAVRGVERVLRREMRRLRSGSTTQSGAKNTATTPTGPSIPLETLPSTATAPQSSIDLTASTATGSFATARTHAGSGSASIVLPSQQAQPPSHGGDGTPSIDLAAPPTPADSAFTGMRTVLSHMDAAIASLAADVSLAADRGWRLLVVAIGSELAALREGRSVLGRAMGEADDGATGLGGEEIEMSPQPRETDGVRSGERRASERDDNNTPTQRDQPLVSFVRNDTEDDGPSLDLLVEEDE